MRFFLIAGALGAALTGCKGDGDGGYDNDDYGDDGGSANGGGDYAEDPEPIGGEGPDLGSLGVSPQARTVFVMTNDSTGNRIVALRHTGDGLERVGSYPTGGDGLGQLELPDLAPMDGIDPLVSEGSLHQKGGFLLTVNAGSSSISSLRVRQNGQLELRDVQPMPGHPTSIASRGDVIFVASSPGPDGTGGGIWTMRMGAGGELEAMGQPLELSDPSAHPSRVLVAGNGRFLVATEVMSDIINVWPLRPGDGGPGERVENLSAGIGPFGAAAFGEDYLLVAEAAPTLAGKASVSTYQIEEDGTLTALTDALGNGQSATCWVQISPDEQYAYTTNTESGTISVYALNEDGTASLIDGEAATPGLGPIDASLSRSGDNLYVLLGGGGSVASYRVEDDGTLQELEIAAGLELPLRGAQGILAWKTNIRARGPAADRVITEDRDRIPGRLGLERSGPVIR